MDADAVWTALLGQQERATTYMVRQNRLCAALMAKLSDWLDLVWGNATLLAEHGLLDAAVDDVTDLVELAEQLVEGNTITSESNLQAIRELSKAIKP